MKMRKKGEVQSGSSTPKNLTEKKGIEVAYHHEKRTLYSKFETTGYLERRQMYEYTDRLIYE